MRVLAALLLSLPGLVLAGDGWNKGTWLKPRMVPVGFERHLTFYAELKTSLGAWGRGDASDTFTRASVATYTNADGTVVDVASGAARFEPSGWLVEGGRTNLCLRSEEFDNAAWVATNVTKSAADAATSPDGTDNAETLTATDANGTVLQSITSASAARAFSVYIKRRTGTGDIDLTVDNGATWTTKTITSSWARYDITQAAVANPVVGFRIVTSGDAIDVWGAQLGNATVVSSYIPTTSASVARAQDKLVYIAAGNLPATGPGTAVWAWKITGPVNVNAMAFDTRDAANADGGVLYLAGAASKFAWWLRSSSATQANVVAAGATASGDNGILAAVWATNDVEFYNDGISLGTDTVATNPTAHARIAVGMANNDGSPWFGHIASLRMFNRRLTSAEIRRLQ